MTLTTCWMRDWTVAGDLGERYDCHMLSPHGDLDHTGRTIPIFTTKCLTQPTVNWEITKL